MIQYIFYIINQILLQIEDEKGYVMSTTIVFLVKNFYNPILFSLIINWGCSCVETLMLSHNKIIKDYK